MKKRIAYLLALCLAAAFIMPACGNKQEAAAPAASEAEQEVTETAAKETPEVTEEATPEVTEAPEDAAEEEATPEASTQGASKLSALYDALDPAAGIHMNYDVYVKSMDTTARYDAYGKGEQYYCRQTVLADGMEDYDTVQCYQDGYMMSLQVKEKTGIRMEAPALDGVAMKYNDLYSAMLLRHAETEYTTEKREIDGTSYDAEIFPENETSYIEQTFCFDEQGNLAYYLVSPSEELGTDEINYKINAIDTSVDESLFDISGYEIKDYETAMQEAGVGEAGAEESGE